MAPNTLASDNSDGIFDELPPDFIISKDNSHIIFNKEIVKSSNDNRSYRIIRLSNGMEALIIHDAEADKAAASMDVNVGSYSDPDNLLGLAHYCEHLLFLGTKKYPKENDYSEFLNKHNGSSNAYTNTENTNYYFEVGHEYLEPALDRFAQFFICPLFNSDCTDRELNAVDSEYKGYLQNDGWRLNQLQRFNSNPKHPLSRFSVGNLETLKEIPTKEGIDTREELIKWYEKHYSANIMKLSILGSDPLDKLTEWVVEKFSDVKNKDIEPFKPHEKPLRKDIELSKQILAKPVKDNHSLEIYIPIPNQREDYKAKAACYASHLIGHEGVGSVCSLLKKKGWITSIYVGPSEVSADFHLFMINIDLTEDGLDHYEDVLEIVFQYIEMLRREGPQEWIFNEIKSLNEITWRFLEKSWESSYTCSLSNRLHRQYPHDEILSDPYIGYEYNPKIITELLDCLRIENCVVSLSSRLLSDFDKKEKWFNAEYRYEPINENLIKKLENPVIHPDLKLCVPNEFIPTNFTVNKLENVTPKTRPDIISDNDFHRVWYKKDDKWWIPKVKIVFVFKSPLIRLTPFNLVKTVLYYHLFDDAFAEEAYDASLAGLSYSMYAVEDNISINVSGYNDKAAKLLELIVNRMKNFIINPERFKVLKERLKRYYNNRRLYSPNTLASIYDMQLFSEIYYSTEESLSALEEINMEDVQSFYPELFKQFFIETQVFGNMEKDEVMNMVKMVEDLFKPKILEKSRIQRSRNVRLPKGKRYVYKRDVYDKDELNSAIEYYLQCGDNKDKYVRNRLQIISQVLQESTFDHLRTKEQLGYSVYSYVSSSVGEIGLIINLQSERDSVYLENRVEAFLIKAQSIIEEMSEEEYQKQKKSLIDSLLEKEKNMWHEAYKYSGQISSEYCDFYKHIEDSENIKTITKDDILEFYKIHINPKSPKIKKLSIHVRSLKCTDNIPEVKSTLTDSNETKVKDHENDKSKQEENEFARLERSKPENYILSEDNIRIDNITDFKNRMCFGPTATPVVPLNTFYAEEMFN
ncbi:Metalloenzyme, LuxS/M16 peptidase-like protein [Glomus cerebriforme]|uniref:Metalloenzyme, LuxS/M16 peptidase-like protein n=1 Tax=Glomus cerebriforme TaxID=658196 RepID=A0A397SBK8_9GLOM|nr:Metalloenzyme, LuxS/M16 peptidase-like protein [Glomus cerebriforme]